MSTTQNSTLQTKQNFRCNRKRRLQRIKPIWNCRHIMLGFRNIASGKTNPVGTWVKNRCRKRDLASQLIRFIAYSRSGSSLQSRNIIRTNFLSHQSADFSSFSRFDPNWTGANNITLSTFWRATRRGEAKWYCGVYSLRRRFDQSLFATRRFQLTLRRKKVRFYNVQRPVPLSAVSAFCHACCKIRFSSFARSSPMCSLCALRPRAIASMPTWRRTCTEGIITKAS